MKYPPWRPGGWLEGACLKLPFTYLLMELLSVLRNAPHLLSAVAVGE
jgi:hypothetical protein